MSYILDAAQYIIYTTPRHIAEAVKSEVAKKNRKNRKND